MLTRRDFLAGLVETLAIQPLCPSAGPLGELLGVVPFASSRSFETPLGRVVGGEGLDARQFTDLSALEADRLITPNDQVFIRTTAPRNLERLIDGWTIATGAAPIAPRELEAAVRPMGAHLIECAGNADPQNFGLMSVAEWDGIPLAEVVPRLKGDGKAVAVRISGLDPDTPSRQSVAGASWVVPFDALDPLGAFLAVRMNGAPLPADHGAPVRLVIPGWYGCSWIKWVNDVRLVGADEPATSQMREFASRTHQSGVPALARDYDAPKIDLAATPVRIEKRRLAGRIQYRVIGIVWGGNRTTDRLRIRFSATDELKAFDLCPAARTHRTWSLWEYRWIPTRPGTYDIVVKAADPAIRTRRLDMYFYTRRVRIDDI